MASNFPQGHTAFVVIHGIGDQKPFEAIDAFTQGVVNYLKQHKQDVVLDHRVCFRRSPKDDRPNWMESYVRISATGDQANWIDVHEFYWAHLTEGKISAGQVRQWLRQTLKGAIASYEANDQYLKQHHPDLKQPQHRPYWWRLNTIIWRLRFIYPIVRLLEALLFRWTPVRIPIEILRQVGIRVVVDFIGDIAIYTSTEQKSSHYTVRQTILQESQALVEAVLQDAEYDRLILAGHSLGSVIAYDTLNRLNVKANNPESGEAFITQLQKIQGLITFGSPLDKVLFYFREQAQEHQFVRAQLLAHIHAFKLKATNLMQQAMNSEVGLRQNPIQPFLNQIWWLNFYDEQDPISGHLDFYEVDDKNNIRLQLGQKWGVAHNYYWGHAPFYQTIFEAMLSHDRTTAQT
ncbi:MAG: hypothetical protein Kow00121_63780 [Elainellaceae cyanobacterium]